MCLWFIAIRNTCKCMIVGSVGDHQSQDSPRLAISDIYESRYAILDFSRAEGDHRGTETLGFDALMLDQAPRAQETGVGVGKAEAGAIERIYVICTMYVASDALNARRHIQRYTRYTVTRHRISCHMPCTLHRVHSAHSPHCSLRCDCGVWT